MVARPAAVAGAFYPDSPRRLAGLVDEMLAVVAVAAGEPMPLGLVVPHAGYRFSGPVAASGYARIAGRHVRRVVLLGPSHFVPVRGLAVPAADAFETPLGIVPVDLTGLAGAANGLDLEVSDKAHASEHSIEVQLPFLQRALPAGWSLAPVAVGHGSAADDVADLLDRLRDPDTLVVASTDLSHYHDAGTARRLDQATAEAVVARAPGAIGRRAACGRAALCGQLAWTNRHDLTVRLLDLRTSADTGGDPFRVVGYGAFAIDPPGPA